MKLILEQELGKWYPILKDDFATPGMIELGKRLSTVAAGELCPSLDKVFRAFRMTAPDKVKVVILGQDPYIAAEADGLAFSSGNGSKPYSLKIIFDALRQVGISRTTETLDDWAEQGVLLINHSLTTVRGISAAHSKWGWQQITDKVLWYLAHRSFECSRPKVFMAWGAYAKKAMTRAGIINKPAMRYLEAAHPASVRYGYIFNGGPMFLEANKFLEYHDQKPIQWGD